MPCSQQYYTPEENFSEQVREFVASCSLHSLWLPVFEKWAEEQIQKDRALFEIDGQKLDADLLETDQKLNRLLDAYLDQVIDPEAYKTKKNEMFEEKLKIQEKISKIKDNGSSWLEPTREVIESSISCYKTARAKNNCHDLRNMAKTVGSPARLWRELHFTGSPSVSNSQNRQF